MDSLSGSDTFLSDIVFPHIHSQSSLICSILGDAKMVSVATLRKTFFLRGRIDSQALFSGQWQFKYSQACCLV